MNTKLIILFCAISAALAYPADFDITSAAADDVQEFLAYPLEEQLQQPQNLERVKRQYMLQGGGGGSGKQGFDISLDGRAPVWTSNNGRHSVDATAGYSQHLGGPYGNSRPDYRGGAVYTFRF